MFSSRYLFRTLALYLLLDELYAFLLPEGSRIKRDVYRLDQDLPPHLSELSDLTDLFPADVGETTRDWGSRQAHPSTFNAPLEHLTIQLQTGKRRRGKDKRRRVTVPLDPIGGSLISSLRSRQDEPEESWEYYAAE